jgi:hypothetical protein
MHAHYTATPNQKQGRRIIVILIQQTTTRTVNLHLPFRHHCLHCHQEGDRPSDGTQLATSSRASITSTQVVKDNPVAPANAAISGRIEDS